MKNTVIVILILAVLGLGVYVVYQETKPNYQPVTRPILVQDSNTAPVTPEPVPTVANPDPTADWKTYTNEKYGFEFKYPESLTISTRVAEVSPYASEGPFFLTEEGFRVKVGETSFYRSDAALDNSETISCGYATYVINKEGKRLVITVTIPTQCSLEAEAHLNKILSTFRFTK